MEHPLMFTMFHAPWCGHCKALKPDFVGASTKAKEERPDVVMAAVDCTVNSAVCGEFGVSGYPTLKAFTSSDGEPTDYQGSRSEDGILAEVRSMKAKGNGAGEGTGGVDTEND